ncbi:hypothetical protein V8G54_025446 [Vigna mungo]|uniref:Uncharacterized protein n=1 Tax=Vigna mungo TaxID=3915 RepID=A0AAQ3MYM5_VIGMU
MENPFQLLYSLCLDPCSPIYSVLFGPLTTLFNFQKVVLRSSISERDFKSSASSLLTMNSPLDSIRSSSSSNPPSSTSWTALSEPKKAYCDASKTAPPVETFPSCLRSSVLGTPPTSPPVPKPSISTMKRKRKQNPERKTKIFKAKRESNTEKIQTLNTISFSVKLET